MMSNPRLFQLYCDHCHWKRITDGTDITDLFEIKTSPVLASTPKLDAETRKTIPAKFQEQKRRFRCPSCGHAMTPRIIADPQKALVDKIALDKRVAERKELEEKVLLRDRKKK